MAIIDHDILKRAAHEKRIIALGDDDNDDELSSDEEETLDQVIASAESDVYGYLAGEYAQATIEANTFVQELCAIRACYYLALRQGPIDPDIRDAFLQSTADLQAIRTGRRELWDATAGAAAARVEAIVQSTSTDQQPVFHATDYDVDGEAKEPDKTGTIDRF